MADGKKKKSKTPVNVTKEAKAPPTPSAREKKGSKSKTPPIIVKEEEDEEARDKTTPFVKEEEASTVDATEDEETTEEATTVDATEEEEEAPPTPSARDKKGKSKTPPTPIVEPAAAETKVALAEAANDGAREFTKALHTLTEMMDDREYDTAPLADRDALLRTYGDGAMFAVTLEATGKRPAMRIVFFPQVSGLKMELIRKAYDGVADYCLVVHSSDKFKPNVAGAAAEIQKKLTPTGNHLQMFTMKELEANVMHHSLQPRFFRMASAEVDQLLADLSMTHEKAARSQLPRINDDDKVARYMGLRPGDIVRIVRDAPTSGEYDTYRICVEAPT